MGAQQSLLSNIEVERSSCIAMARYRLRKGNDKFIAGDYEGAKTQYRKALTSLQASSDDENHRSKATVLSNVACLEFASGEYANAKALFQEALALRRNICVDECAKTSKDGSNNESKDASKSPIADSQIEEDISFRALELSLKAGYVFKETPGGDRNEKNYLDCTRMVAVLEERKKIDDMLADSCNNMAACCEELGDYDEAVKLYAESMQLRKLIDGDRSIKVAESIQNYATLHDTIGNVREAEKLYREALAIYDRCVENRRPLDTAVTLNNLGLLLCGMNRCGEAEQCLRDCLQIRQEGIPEDIKSIEAVKKNINFTINKRRSLGCQDSQLLC